MEPLMETPLVPFYNAHTEQTAPNQSGCLHHIFPSRSEFSASVQCESPIYLARHNDARFKRLQIFKRGHAGNNIDAKMGKSVE